MQQANIYLSLRIVKITNDELDALINYSPSSRQIYTCLNFSANKLLNFVICEFKIKPDDQFKKKKKRKQIAWKEIDTRG